MPRMPGVQFADPASGSAMTPRERLGVARAMGACLADLHALEWPVAGRFDLATGAIKPDAIGHREAILGAIQNFAARPGSLTAEDHAWVSELIAANDAALASPFVPGVVVHDYKEGNVTVIGAGDAWRVSGVFDLMECFMGNREQDLARQTAEYVSENVALARAFVQTYLRRRPAAPGLLERLRLYTLYDRMLIWDYFVANQGAWPVPGETLRSWAGRAIDALPQVVL